MLVGHLANLLLVCDPGAAWMFGAVNREKPTPRHSPRGGRSGQPGNSETRNVDVTGDYGYVVVPAIMTFDLRGKQVTQTVRFIRWRFARWAQRGL